MADLTPRCHAAGNSILRLSEGARAGLHRGCRGAWRSADGVVGACECACHAGLDRTAELSDDERAALVPPVVPRGVGPAATAETEKRPPVASGSTPGAGGPARTCECGCGAAVKRRFLPGHDAKLKSRLHREAESGDLSARLRATTELAARGW